MVKRKNSAVYRARDAKAKAEGFRSFYDKRRYTQAEREATKVCPCCGGSGRVPNGAPSGDEEAVTLP